MPRTAADKMEEANKVADKASENIDKTLNTFQQKVRRANEKMNMECTKAARKMIMKNFSSSGIKSQTGKLKTAIDNINCVVTLLARKPKITIHMPDNVSDYSKKEGGGNFYKVANALNAGAIRGSSEKNKKRRKAIKKKVQKNAAKKNPKGGVVAQGYVLEGGKTTKSGSTTFAGGTSVTKAFPFWNLTSTQQAELQGVAVSVFNKVVFGN